MPAKGNGNEEASLFLSIRHFERSGGGARIGAAAFTFSVAFAPGAEARRRDHRLGIGRGRARRGQLREPRPRGGPEPQPRPGPRDAAGGDAERLRVQRRRQRRRLLVPEPARLRPAPDRRLRERRAAQRAREPAGLLHRRRRSRVGARPRSRCSAAPARRSTARRRSAAVVNLETGALAAEPPRRSCVLGAASFGTFRGSLQYAFPFDAGRSVAERARRPRAQRRLPRARLHAPLARASSATSGPASDSVLRVKLFGGPEETQLAYLGVPIANLRGEISGDADVDRRQNPLREGETDTFFQPQLQVLHDLKLEGRPAAQEHALRDRGRRLFQAVSGEPRLRPARPRAADGGLPREADPPGLAPSRDLAAADGLGAVAGVRDRQEPAGGRARGPAPRRPPLRVGQRRLRLLAAPTTAARCLAPSRAHRAAAALRLHRPQDDARGVRARDLVGDSPAAPLRGAPGDAATRSGCARTWCAATPGTATTAS